MSRERSFLSVPASNPRRFETALATEADVVLLDLEDSVVPAQKPASRANIITAARELDWGRRRLAYRVNGLDTPFFYRDLIEIVEEVAGRVGHIVVPKVGRPEDIAVVDTLLRQIEMSVAAEPGRIRLQAQIETAAGLINVERIAGASPRLGSLIFGPGDFSASVGMPLTSIGAMDEWDARYPGHRYHYVMARMVTAAAAYGLGAVDGPLADFHDDEGLRASCYRARALGYSGKWCIHPAQVPIINEIFTPTDAERAWAQQVMDAYRESQGEGQGAMRLGDRMIDEASVRMARTILEGG